MPTDTLQHPTLNCTLRGKPSPSGSTIQFRNLKYASIPGRWQHSIPNNTIIPNSAGGFDATTFGPSCPHKRGAREWDLTLVGDVDLPLGEGHAGEEEAMDEFECLTVNVTVPKSVLEKEKTTGEGGAAGLPVFVWVHGGGLSIGSNSWPQYNLTRIVERSVEIGKPMIGVSINYRVGILGFLASEELAIDGNFGFKDQVLAFRWVRKHIAGFGGDPANVTASGESAGGISLSTLLCAEVGPEGLFDRVVVMSGEVTLRKPRTKAWHEHMYHDQLKFLALDTMDIEARKKKLWTASAEELASKLPLAQHFCACIDGAFMKQDVTLGILSDGSHKLHKPAWCKEFVVGDAVNDATILKSRILDNPNVLSVLLSCCATHLTPTETTTLLSAYNIPIPTITTSSSSPSPYPPNLTPQIHQNLLTLASDLRFYLPTLCTHIGWKTHTPPKRSHRYHVHTPNPLAGPFAGLPGSHELDVALLLGNFDDAHVDVNAAARDVGRQMADVWIGFAAGEGWGGCGDGEVVVVIGERGVGVVGEGVYDKRWRGGRGRVLEGIGGEKLWRVVEGWQGVRSDDEVGREGRVKL